MAACSAASTAAEPMWPPASGSAIAGHSSAVTGSRSLAARSNRGAGLVRAQDRYGAAGHAIMRRSLPVVDGNEPRAEGRTRWLVRHAVVAWLLVVEPVSLALTLDRALPRMP